METNNVQVEQSMSEEISFAEIFFHYLSYWKWFVISVIACLLIAFIYLRYTTREYSVTSKVLIKDDKKGQTPFDMNAFSDLGLVPQVSSFDNELEVLLSKTLMKEVVDSLKIGVSYYSEGKIKKEEIYNNTPVFVSVSNQTDIGAFVIEKAEDNTFTLTAKSENFTKKFNLNDEGIDSPWGVLRFKENPFGTKEYPIEVFINHPKSRPLVQITPINKQTSVVNISTVTAVPQKGEDIINTLVGIYNQKAIDEKNYVATNTIHFIDDRLRIISGELETAEKDVESYKRSRGLTDIQAEAQLFLSAQSDYGRKISEVGVQLDLLRSVKNFLVESNNSSVAPSNVGLTDPTILTLIQKYNEEILAKNRNTLGMTVNNPAVKEYDERIALMRDNLIKGINLSEASLQTNLRELNKQENSFQGKAMGLSTQERESRELYRQKEIKETLFIYLLQKREETGLSLALATPNAIVIDAADYFPVPVKPKRNIILLAALLLGVIIPVMIIYIRDLFDNKLRNKEQLSKVVKAPFLGDLPQVKSTKPFPVLNVRSGIAERFRIVSSNLGFIASGGQSKVIMITSSYSGEGKSFFSQNLAMSLATSGKKTLLIDLDIRKSLLNKTLEMTPSKGVAMYLADPSISVKEIIDRSGNFHKNLDIIPIKVFPPNPAELLASDRLDLLFQTVANEYDYIIVDTAPVGLVADAFRINQFADATIYVTRADYTYKSTLPDIQLLYKENRLHNLTTVLNAVPHKSGYGYHYGYGYGYGHKKGNKYYTEDN
ncbi:MAG: polysaccharide biosynthesis tyrosine autokinase [Candidatus Symbiothrix sp.]|jgi:capsular exopolysaccharide synthesis family protein|nr:polysaccharide biosynthesis tyrosine autokinase [Candidatus Symbiothrix sp.]